MMMGNDGDQTERTPLNAEMGLETNYNPVEIVL
jgi:hypothetical protein